MSLGRLQQDMSTLLAKHTAGQEDIVTAIDDFGLFRRNTTTEPCDCVVEPSIVFVTQGEKQLLIGDKAYGYDVERFLLSSLEVPARSQVISATPEKPSLGVVLKLDIALLTELIAQHTITPPRDRLNTECAHIGTLTMSLLEPFSRLIKLLDTPTDIPVMAPMIRREIHYRLLQSDLAPRLWQLATLGSQNQRISRAIDWLKDNYSQPLSIEKLANHVQMSSSSLHHHFRQLTAKSPLQYQKWLRLTEARRLMLNDGVEAAQAAFDVGYESPSQFSREYSRQFGAPPKRDIASLRLHQPA